MMLRSTLLVALVLWLTGCQPMEVIGVDRSDYLLADSSGTKRLHVAQIAIDNSLFILPVPGLLRTLLVEDIPQNPGWLDALKMVASATKERDLNRIWRAANAMTKDVHFTRIRWIVSTRPLAVAIGRDTREGGPPFMGANGPWHSQGGRVLLGMNQRLVTDADLNEPVETVFMPQDDWTGGWEEEDAKHTTSVRLQSGMTIGQLISEWPVRFPK